ncbi:MAG: glutathione S-transferase family protein [Nevskia sp.]
MSDIILHHYPLSPYSEKLRAVLGFKKLAWKSVITPVMLPKPDLLPLTGGYRKAPVMQIGRDIYCDSALMLRVIDRLAPNPPLAPGPLRASCAAFAQIEQTLFFAAVSTMFQPAGLKALIERLGADGMQQFAKDRTALFTGGSAVRPGPDYGKVHFLPLMNALDLQLQSAPFLLGAEPTLADFCMFHPVWFIRGNPGVAGTLAPFKALLAWFERIRTLGHGRSSEISGAEAIAIARAASGGQPFDGPVLEPDGLKLGMRVQVSATDYGTDPVVGTLVHASAFELAVKRSDAQAGEVVVHFPRAGFGIAPAAA